MGQCQSEQLCCNNQWQQNNEEDKGFEHQFDFFEEIKSYNSEGYEYIINISKQSDEQHEYIDLFEKIQISQSLMMDNQDNSQFMYKSLKINPFDSQSQSYDNYYTQL